MAIFRYRRNTAHADVEAIARLKQELIRRYEGNPQQYYRDYNLDSEERSPPTPEKLGEIAGQSTPLMVTTEEGSASGEELVEMLKSGRLLPGDLVWSRDTWTTFSQHPNFYEACEGLPDGSGRANMLVVAVLVALISFMALCCLSVR